MSTISVRVDADNVRIGLTKFGKALPDIVARAIETKYAERVKKKMSGEYRGGRSYGVPLPASGANVRTGNYGRSVTWEKEGLAYRFFNTAYSKSGYNYGVKLTGDASGNGQAWWARNRWPIARRVVEDETLSLVSELDKDIQKGIEAAGL